MNLTAAWGGSERQRQLHARPFGRPEKNFLGDHRARICINPDLHVACSNCSLTSSHLYSSASMVSFRGLGATSRIPSASPRISSRAGPPPVRWRARISSTVSSSARISSSASARISLAPYFNELPGLMQRCDSASEKSNPQSHFVTIF